MKKTKARKVEIRKPSPAEPGSQAEEETASGMDGLPATEEAPDAVATLQARIEKLEDGLLRAKADYQNLQRRAATERSQAIRYGNAELFKGLLGVVDDFERALAAAEATENHDAVVRGVRMVYENLTRSLTAQGLETIDALHQPFDPSIHEALLQQPSAEHPAGTVIEEVAKGYRLHDRVLRPSKVVVSKGDDTDAEDKPVGGSCAGEPETGSRGA